MRGKLGVHGWHTHLLLLHHQKLGISHVKPPQFLQKFLRTYPPLTHETYRHRHRSVPEAEPDIQGA